MSYGGSQAANYDTVQHDTIFISGLPEDTTEQQLTDYFGSIGIIKFDKRNNKSKIWIYKDKTSGRGKGEATITYDDPPTASSAIQWFNGKDFHGSKITVELAQRKNAPSFDRNRRAGGGPRGGGGDRGDRADRADRGDRFDRNDRGDRGGGARSRDDRGGSRGGRPGDWLCTDCNNNNFSYRTECNRCQAPKPAGAGSNDDNNNRSSYGGGGNRSGYGSNRGGSDHRRGGGYRDNNSYGGGGPTRGPPRGGGDRRQRPY